MNYFLGLITLPVIYLIWIIYNKWRKLEYVDCGVYPQDKNYILVIYQNWRHKVKMYLVNQSEEDDVICYPFDDYYLHNSVSRIKSLKKIEFVKSTIKENFQGKEFSMVQIFNLLERGEVDG